MKTRILLVDDERDFTDTLKQRLEFREFTVTAAYSGEEALGFIDKDNMDIVILDVQMPGLSGIETLEKIKEIAPLVEVIMLTGHATVENAIQGMKLGAFDYLMKPAETDDLVRKIDEAAEIKHARDERIRKAEIDKIISERGW